MANVDVAVQAFRRERLAALAPDVQFRGEEQDNTGLDWSRPLEAAEARPPGGIGGYRRGW